MTSRRVELISIDDASSPSTSNQLRNQNKRNINDDSDEDDEDLTHNSKSSSSTSKKRIRISSSESTLLTKLAPFDCLVTLAPICYARFYCLLADFLERSVNDELENKNERFSIDLDYIHGISQAHI
jgi:hypothetical protein